MKRRADGRFCKTLTIDGKRVFFFSSAENEKQASKEIEKKLIEYQIEQSTKSEQFKIFKNIANRWQEEHYKTIAYKTQTGYDAPFNRIVEKFGETPINEIKPMQVNKFLISLGQKGYALKTVKTHLLIFNLIFTYAMLHGEIENNIVDAVKVPKNLKQEKRELPSNDEIEKVKSSLENSFGLFAYLLLYSGCRRGEALALKYEDIDRENKIISINKSLYFESNKPIIKEPKTKAGHRNIVLMDKLLEMLPTDKKGYIFSDNGEKPLTEQAFRRRWEKYIKETGINLTPHQLRHAYATILFEAGIAEKDAQELLGHSSISVTKDIYTHISKNRKDETLKKLNDFVSGKKPKKKFYLKRGNIKK